MAKKQEFNGWFQHIEGDMRVFCDEVTYRKNGKKATFLKATTSVAKKDESGNWHNVYIPVTFTKDCGVELSEDRYDVHVNEGFATVDFWTDKDGNEHARFAIVVTDAEIII